MTLAIAQSLAGTAVVSDLPARANEAELQQLVAELIGLITQDPRAAAHALQSNFAAAPDDANTQLAGAVAAGLDDPTLTGLSQTTDGRQLLAVLDAHAGTAESDTPLGRVRNALASLTHGASDWGWAGAVSHQAVRRGAFDAMPAKGAEARATSPEAQVTSAFKEEFAAKAANKEEFDAFMQQVFGDAYDKNLAEQFRQRALAGDFTWLPEVKFVDAATLNGGNGAYNAEEGVVYINRDLAACDPAKAAQTFVEEAGHHLDAQLNTADTRGDEGEMFRRALGGEQLSQHELDAIRNQNDKGTITVDGKQVDVEFWFGEDIADAVGDAASAVGDAASDVVDAVGGAAGDVVDAVGSAAGDVVDYVGNAARDVVYSLGDAVKESVMGVIDGLHIFMKGFAVDFFGGTIINLFNGRIADAWDSLVRGLDQMVFQGPRRILNGALEGVGHWLKTATYILPADLGGNLAREVIDRGVDSVRTVANAFVDVVRNTVRLPFEIIGGIERDIGEALKYFARGDIGEGFGRLGLTVVHPFERVAGTFVDNVMVVAQGVGNVVGNVFGLHEPSRGLNKEERAFLKQTYGDSINVEDIRIHKGNLTHELGMAPHCVGNDIYLPDDCFNGDGTLNEKGRMTLVHEAFHVYQSQKGGNDYIHNALESQVEGIVDGGNRNAAYNFLPALREGKPFNEWNPEQQAKFMETYARARFQRIDTNGDGMLDSDYDANNDGQLDRTEFEMALADTNRNGRIDPPDGNPNTVDEQAVTITDAQFQELMVIAATIKTDRPDRTVV